MTYGCVCAIILYCLYREHITNTQRHETSEQIEQVPNTDASGGLEIELETTTLLYN